MKLLKKHGMKCMEIVSVDFRFTRGNLKMAKINGKTFFNKKKHFLTNKTFFNKKNIFSQKKHFEFQTHQKNTFVGRSKSSHKNISRLHLLVF
jgi:hypothetical protein